MATRELKFRAWDSEKMHYVELLYYDRDFDEDDIIMQYTGLKDKNGKEIYEGDIVTDGEFKYEIKYIDFFASFLPTSFLPFSSKRSFTCSHYNRVDGDLMEVIGNIHETPELMK